MHNVRREWDRLIVHSLFVLFGVRSIFNPLRTLKDVVPTWTTILLSAEFIIGGLMLVYGDLFGKTSASRAGYIVGFISLFTVSAVVGFTIGSTLAWVLLAFSFKELVELRRLKERSMTQTLEEIKTTIGDIEQRRKSR